MFPAAPTGAWNAGRLSERRCTAPSGGASASNSTAGGASGGSCEWCALLTHLRDDERGVVGAIWRGICGTSCSSPARPGSVRSKPPQSSRRRPMRALVYHGPGPQGLGRSPQADDRRRHRRDRARRRGHDLRHRPAHPQGRRPRGDRRTDPRPRGGRHRRGGRRRREEREGRRPGARLVHHRVRRVPVLPRGPLRPVPRRRRLDPRPPDRRHPGRVRAGAVRRHVDLPGPRRA